ncbi:hypothetical protein [Proteiniclasticum sp.]|uniref:hypothetical protein n=1 Tax=Proteiniclasticum sp. TaxID=2053595 RepID=UPI00289FAADA|nr:hypothetical protein [Proteiniclasticum sp.]
MRKMSYPIAILLLLLMITGCTAKEEYYSREEALNQGYIVLDGTNSENGERFDIFIQNVDAKRDDSIIIVIYDLTKSQYVIDIHYDGDKIHASRYFMDQKSKKSQIMSDMLFTHISKTASKNYFLIDELKIHPDLWIYQGN